MVDRQTVDWSRLLPWLLTVVFTAGGVLVTLQILRTEVTSLEPQVMGLRNEQVRMLTEQTKMEGRMSRLEEQSDEGKIERKAFRDSLERLDRKVDALCLATGANCKGNR